MASDGAPCSAEALQRSGCDRSCPSCEFETRRWQVKAVADWYRRWREDIPMEARRRLVEILKRDEPE